jgi:methionyl-tRNA formyltransferase
MEEETKSGPGVGVVSGLPSLVFLGTPDFAVPSLRMLAEAGADLRLVVTQPDRAQGRGRKLAPPPIKAVALELGIPVYQPQRLRAAEAVERVGSAGVECLAVVAYGQLLPQELLVKAPLGAVNVHASLLPRYRGAAPIQRALLDGVRTTGISIMLLDAGMDTGPLLYQQVLPVGERETSGSLHDKLANLGAELLLSTLRLWKTGRLAPLPQNGDLATNAPPIRKEEIRMDWQQEARRIVNHIRAFDPWPGAHCQYQGRRIKCFDGMLLPWKGQGRPGEIIGVGETGLVVLGGNQHALSIGALQLDGHRRLAAADFVRGHEMLRGTWLE